jgi:hypothetical protein
MGGPIAAILMPALDLMRAGEAPSFRTVLGWVSGAVLLLAYGVIIAYLGYRIRESAMKRARAVNDPNSNRSGHQQ